MVSTITIESEGISVRSYADLIKEVYIDPIRSAIIVDDTYPMVETLLENALSVEDVKKGTEKDNEGLLKVIKSCRDQPKPWLVDVHDGKGLEDLEAITGHFKRLHQSDLMILDYNLDGEGAGNAKACNVLKSLSSNNYFNLVIIYTNCDVATIPTRVTEIVKSLTYKNLRKDLSRETPPEITIWDDRDIDLKVTALLKSELDLPMFLKLFHEPDTSKWQELIGGSRLDRLLIEEQKNHQSPIIVPALVWLVAAYFPEVESALSNSELGKVEFELGATNWIRTDTLFITVVRKAVEPDKLVTCLLNALEESDPSPHRLLMTKIRNVLDEKGISAERQILAKRFMQAGWLKEMMSSQEGEKYWKLKKAVSHHWDELANQVSDEVQEYASQLFASILDTENNDVKKIIKRFTSIDISNVDQINEVMLEWNSYVCNKNIEGHHLMPGHIFELQQNLGLKELWICLTPICDLVPRAANRKWAGKDTTIGLIPFKAVQLIQEDNLKAALKNASRSEYIFIGSGKDWKAYKYAKDASARPTWNQFFAHEEGVFNQQHLIKLSCVDLQLEQNDLKVGRLKFEAKIVSQLRYEYALHLLQKLGASFSKIGLEFVNHP